MKWQWWFVGGVVALGAVLLRLFTLGESSYWLDEGYSVTIAQAIADHGYPLLDSGALIWRSPLYHYALGGWVALFGTEEFATRLLSVLFSLGAIVIITYGAKHWFGGRVAYIAFILASFATWEIAWSRQARMYLALQVFFWLAVIVFQRWYDQAGFKINRQFWFMALTLTLALLTHEFAWLLLIILPGYVVIKRWVKQPGRLVWYMIGLFLLLPVMIGALHYGLDQPVPVNYWTHYVAFLWREETLLVLLAGFSLVIAQRTHLTIIFWLSTVGLFGLGLFSFGITLLHYRYLFFLYPIVLWLATYTIDWLLSWRLKWVGYGTAIIIATALVWHQELTMLPKTFWPLESDSKTSQFTYKSFTPQPNFRAAYAAIAQQDADTVITPYPELSRLYLERDDTYALYLDVIGAADQPNRSTQIYTGVPYLTLTELKRAQQNHTLVLLDYFSQRRIQPELREYIEQYGQVIYTEVTNEWSTVTVYKF